MSEEPPRRDARFQRKLAPDWHAWLASALFHVILLASIAIFPIWTPPIPLASEAIPVTLAYDAAPAAAPPPATVPSTAPEPLPPKAATAPPDDPAPSQLPEATARPDRTPPEPASSAVPERPAAPPKYSTSEPPEVAPAPQPAPKRRAQPQAPAAPRPPVARLPARAGSAPAPASPLSPGFTLPQQQAFAPLIPPRPLSGHASNRKPDYPLAARSRRQQGRVLLRVHVSAAGDAGSVEIVSSSGHPILDQAARAAVQTWRFVPATRAGVAVAAQADVPIEFRMND